MISAETIHFLYRLFGNLLLCILLGLCSIIIGGLVPKDIDYTKFPFRSFEWEDNGKIYTKLHITAWKDKLPDLSKYMTAIFRKTVPFGRNYKHFLLFVQETCIAETVHLFLIAISPVYLYINKDSFGIWIMLSNILGNLPFIMVQRFNRPRLLHVLEKQYERLAPPSDKKPVNI